MKLQKVRLCSIYHLTNTYDTNRVKYYFKTKDKLHENDIVLCKTKYGLVIGKVIEPDITLNELIDSQNNSVNFVSLQECEKYPSLNTIRKKNKDASECLPF